MHTSVNISEKPAYFYTPFERVCLRHISLNWMNYLGRLCNIQIYSWFIKSNLQATITSFEQLFTQLRRFYLLLVSAQYILWVANFLWIWVSAFFLARSKCNIAKHKQPSFTFLSVVKCLYLFRVFRWAVFPYQTESSPRLAPPAWPTLPMPSQFARRPAFALWLFANAFFIYLWYLYIRNTNADINNRNVCVCARVCSCVWHGFTFIGAYQRWFFFCFS